VGHLENLPRFFRGTPGRALAIVIGAAPRLGPLAVQLLTDAVIGSSGWRSAYLVLAIVAITWQRPSRFSSASPPAPARSHAASPRRPPRFRQGRGPARPCFRCVAATLFGCTALVAAATLGFQRALVALIHRPRLRHNHRGGVAAGAGVGRSHRKAAHRYSWTESRPFASEASPSHSASAGFVVLSLPVASSPVLYSLGAVLVAVALGAEGDLVPFMVRRLLRMSPTERPRRHAGAFALGGAIGPVLYGLSFDLLNSYEPALGLSALVVLAAGVGLQTLGPYRYPSAGRLPVDSSPPTRRG